MNRGRRPVSMAESRVEELFCAFGQTCVHARERALCAKRRRRSGPGLPLASTAEGIGASSGECTRRALVAPRCMANSPESAPPVAKTGYREGRTPRKSPRGPPRAVPFGAPLGRSSSGAVQNPSSRTFPRAQRRRGLPLALASGSPRGRGAFVVAGFCHSKGPSGGGMPPWPLSFPSRCAPAFPA